jgi:hypothetical protein
MSEENVELTRLLLDAFNRGDVDAVVALWDDEECGIRPSKR